MRKWWRCGGRGCVQPCPVGIAGSILVAIVQAAAGASDGEGGGQADSAECSVNMDEKKMDWTKSCCATVQGEGGSSTAREGNMPFEASALEKLICDYAEKLGDDIIDPCLGTTFSSLSEAYDFYNLYSWQHCFGIRYGKSRLNAEKTKCMQEIVCECSGKPKDENTKFCRCECPPKLGLRRTSDSRWYIIEHRLKHNHTIMDNCGKKVFCNAHRPVHRGPCPSAMGQQHKHWESVQNNRRRLRKCRKCAVHKMVTSEHVWLAKMQADGERLRAE
ncbi:uncharacterized protein [Lolium perenne]|uniref:uncharacterized protein isoform X1 n=1 Tax=Lolium perenne TaxID=4522 RepID=UPI0021F53133|nr:uncharacterized protein LOC127292159 isoform X3 [Lolium perenne]